MALLPPRPYRLRRWFVLRIYLVAILGPLAALGGVAANLSALEKLEEELQHEEELVRSGAVAQVQLDGNARKPGLLMHDYRLHFRFSDMAGTKQESVEVFSSLGSEAALSQPGKVYYSPNNPADCVLSYAVELRSGRLALAGLWLVFSGVLFAGFVAVVRLELRDLRKARRCASASEEVLLPIIRKKESWLSARGTQPISYYYRSAAPCAESPPEEQLVVFDAHRHTPLFADPPGTDKRATPQQMLALRAADGQIVVLRDDLYPFAFTKEERRLVQQRIAAGKGKPQVT